MKIPLGKAFPIFFILLVAVLEGAIAEKLLWEGHLYPDFLISDAHVAKDTQLQASNDTTPLKQYYVQHLIGCEKYYRSLSRPGVRGNDLKPLCKVPTNNTNLDVFQSDAQLLVRCSRWNVFRVTPSKPTDDVTDKFKPMAGMVGSRMTYNRLSKELLHGDPVGTFFVGLDGGKKQLFLKYCFIGVDQTPP